MPGKGKGTGGNRQRPRQTARRTDVPQSPSTSTPRTSTLWGSDTPLREILNPRAWVLLPRANRHFCNDVSKFTGTFNAIEPIVVWDKAFYTKPTLQDPTTLIARGIGDVKLKVRKADGSERMMSLFNVLYVPNLPVNMISFYMAEDQFFSTSFDRVHGITMEDGDGVISFSKTPLPTLNLADTYDRLFREGVDEEENRSIALGLYVEDRPKLLQTYPGTAKAAAEEPGSRNPNEYEDVPKGSRPNPHAAKVEDESDITWADLFTYFKELGETDICELPRIMADLVPVLKILRAMSFDDEFSSVASEPEAGPSNMYQLGGEMHSTSSPVGSAARLDAIENILSATAREVDGDALSKMLDRKLTLTVGEFFKLAPEVSDRLVGKVSGRPEERLRNEFGSRMKSQNSSGVGCEFALHRCGCE